MAICATRSRRRHIVQCAVLVVFSLSFHLTLEFSSKSSSYLDSINAKRINNIPSAEAENLWYKARSGGLLTNSESHSTENQPPTTEVKTNGKPLPTGFGNSDVTLPGWSTGSDFSKDNGPPLLIESKGLDMPGVRNDIPSVQIDKSSVVMDSSRFSGSYILQQLVKLNDDHMSVVRLVNSEERIDGSRISNLPDFNKSIPNPTTYNVNSLDQNRHKYNLLKQILLFKIKTENKILHFSDLSFGGTPKSEDHEVASKENQPNSDVTVSFKNNQQSSDISASLNHQQNSNGFDITVSLHGNLVLIRPTADDMASSKRDDSDESSFDSNATQDNQLIDLNITNREQSLDERVQSLDERVQFSDELVQTLDERLKVDSILRIILLGPARAIFTKRIKDHMSHDSTQMPRENSKNDGEMEEKGDLEDAAVPDTTVEDAPRFSHPLTARISDAYDSVTHNTKLLLSYSTGDGDAKPVAYDSEGNVVECVPSPFVDCGEYARDADKTTDGADHAADEPTDSHEDDFTTSGQREQAGNTNVRLFTEDGDRVETYGRRHEKGKSPASRGIVSEVFKGLQDNKQTNVIVIFNNFVDGKKKSGYHKDGAYEL